MADLFFIIKTMVLTVILVLLMQIRLGGQTIDDQIASFARGSALTEAIQNVAAGGVKLLTQAYRTVAGTVDEQIGDGVSRAQSAGSRALNFDFRRSDGYFKEQERKKAAKEQAEEGPEISDSIAD